MKTFKKYASAFALLLIFLLICQVISHAALFLVNTVYSALHKWFGDAFPLYSPIGDSRGYEVYSAVTGLIAYTLSLLLSVYLACLLSNAKNERLISRTEGFFTVREGFSIYLKEFILPDATASAVCSFILLIPIREKIRENSHSRCIKATDNLTSTSCSAYNFLDLIS